MTIASFESVKISKVNVECKDFPIRILIEGLTYFQSGLLAEAGNLIRCQQNNKEIFVVSSYDDDANVRLLWEHTEPAQQMYEAINAAYAADMKRYHEPDPVMTVLVNENPQDILDWDNFTKNIAALAGDESVHADMECEGAGSGIKADGTTTSVKIKFVNSRQMELRSSLAKVLKEKCLKFKWCHNALFIPISVFEKLGVVVPKQLQNVYY